MPQICLYFHLHQPYRLKEMNVFDVGKKRTSYFYSKKDDDNKKIFLKVAEKSYFPMLRLLLKLAKEEKKFKFAISIPGTFIEQCLAFEPEVLNLLKEIHKTGKLEILAETYYHSLAFLYSPKEFYFQIRKHLKIIKKHFGVTPTVFRNTELIYSNYVAELLSKFQFKGILTEAVDRYLDGKSRTQVFASNTAVKIPLMLKHAKLSDDIAFRFSNKQWPMYPLTVEKYSRWINVFSEEQYVNLFMDFETFGEHHWEDTGIFEFFEEFIKSFLSKKWNKLVSPNQVFSKLTKKISKLPVYDVPEYISWADIDRSITAWRDNALQYDILYKVYSMREKILKSGNKRLIEDWRRLQSSDHYYYMCTKWSEDGDVHSYFSPYESPFEAYRRFSIVLADLEERLLKFRL